MIRQPADELVKRLKKVHDEDISTVLRNYLDEYADYGWDSICTELANVNAQIDLIMTELQYAVVKKDVMYK